MRLQIQMAISGFTLHQDASWAPLGTGGFLDPGTEHAGEAIYIYCGPRTP